MNILLTDAESKHTLGITRLLGKYGYNVFALAVKNRFCISKYSKYCTKVLYSCNYDDESLESQYIKELREYVLTYNIDLIIPVGYKNCSLISKYSEELSKITKTITVPYEKILFASNKAKILETAKKLNLPIPETYYPDSLEKIHDLAQKISFPCVIKSRFEHGCNVVAFPSSAKELINYYASMLKQYGFCNSKEYPMIQEYLCGDGYGFFALYLNGKCTQIFMHHRIREYPVKGGASSCCESYYDPELLQLGKSLLDYLEWNGVAMVEFKKDSSGKYRLMEINPKYWGSLDLALEAGALFPLLQAKYIQNEKIEYSEKYDRNLRYHWPFPGDWKHAIEKPENFFNVLLDCINPKTKSNLWFHDDLKATIFILLSAPYFAMKKLLRKVKKLFYEL